MARRYAEGTTVPVEKSKAEIETLLRKHGATGFLSAWDDERGVSVVQCRIGGRMIRFEVLDPDDSEFKHDHHGFLRSADSVAKLRDAELRRRWRARLLITKAKLEMIATGDTTFEREFLGDILLPNGETVDEWIVPQIAAAYESGSMPKLLTSGRKKREP